MLTTKIHHKGKIYIQYKTKSDKRILSTNISVDQNYWSKVKREVLPSDSDYLNKNNTIIQVQNTWEKIILNYINEFGFKPTATVAKTLFTNRITEIRTNEKATLIEYFTEFSNEKKSEFILNDKENSHKDYKSTLTILRLYEELNNKKIYILDLTDKTWLLEFEKFLKKKKKIPKDKSFPKRMQDGQKEKTRKKRFAILITFADWLIENKKFNYDFSNIKKRSKKIKVPKNIGEVITVDELNKIIDYKFDKYNHQRVIDMFVISNHLGLRFGDVTA